MSKLIKVGQMPGTITEVAVTEGTSIAEVLSIAGLDRTGFEVKVDQNTVTDLDNAVVGANTSLVLLTKQVKGNALIKIGQMPGTITEYALEDGTTFRQALDQAGLNADGYEVKADQHTVTNLDNAVGNTSLILLTKKVKGNALIKIGQMPGTITEYALESNTTFRQALEQAGLQRDGYEVKADQNTVQDLDQPIGSTSLILLTKQVKGN